MPAGNVARVATPTGALLFLDQRFVRMSRRDVVVDDRRAVAQRLRRRSVCFDCHNQLLAMSFLALSSNLYLSFRTTSAARNLLLATFTDSARTPASSRRHAVAHTPSSSRDGSRQTFRAVVPSRDTWRCGQTLL